MNLESQSAYELIYEMQNIVLNDIRQKKACEDSVIVTWKVPVWIFHLSHGLKSILLTELMPDIISVYVRQT